MHAFGKVETGRADVTDAPLARAIDLVVTESGGEVLVYDTAVHHIHHLNHVTAVIWRRCDGRQSIGDLVRLARLDAGDDIDEAVVRLAPTKLDDANLLDGPLAPGLRQQETSRRSLMKKAALASAIPAIVSISAPTAAAANSQCVNPGMAEAGTPCFSNSACCSNVCDFVPDGPRQCI
ncbi:MAG: PqqD family protein [Chloroflexota bacterium]|nr:PqqD family protein [Chloroflexota bacterium]